MGDEIDKKVLFKFYSNYLEESVFILFLKILSTLGFFLFNWIYQLNKKFEDAGFELAPDSRRGVVVLFFLPFSWIFIMLILRVLIFPEFSNVLWYFDIFVWFLLIFLILQYLYDFCRSFGFFTVSNSFFWYMFLWVGFFPLVLLFFGNFYFWPIIFFPIITICLMQRKLNSEYERFLLRGRTENHYMHGGK